MFDLSFTIANGLATVGWILLVVMPNHKITKSVVRSKILPVVLAVGYTVFIVIGMTGGESEGNFFSIEGVRSLFQSDAALLAGWIHYLCFDMMVGIHELDEGQKLGIPHGVLIVTMLLTFWFGPMGFLLYSIIRKKYSHAIPYKPAG